MTDSPTRTKLCWNCEGTVAREAQHCPYCGVYIQRDEDADLKFQEEAPPTPYGTTPAPQEEEVPPSPFIREEEAPPESEQMTTPTHQSEQGWQTIALPLSFLLSGSLFFLFGLFLLLFSYQGTFTLQWDSSYWLFYLILSTPLLYLGWRFLSKVEEPA